MYRIFTFYVSVEKYTKKPLLVLLYFLVYELKYKVIVTRLYKLMCLSLYSIITLLNASVFHLPKSKGFAQVHSQFVLTVPLFA